MRQWFLNKGLKFQIILIMGLIFIIPTVITIGNILMPSKVGNAIKSMQEERLKNLLYYLDDSADKSEIYSLKNGDKYLNNVELKIRSEFEPHSRSTRGTWLGIYLMSNSKNYTFENDISDNSLQRYKPPSNDSMQKELINDISLVSKDGKDKIHYINMNGLEILRYLHPLTLNNEVIAVIWAETPMPPEINSGRKNLIYILFFAILALAIGLFLMLIIIKNLSSNIVKIRSGLEVMSGDLSFRIEPMEGDIGEIAESVNTMAEALFKKEQLEEQLVRSEKLASLGQLISGVAHEIRNPLSIIRGTVQLMERDFKKTDGLEEYIRIVKEQSDRENRVIQELLDYARPSKQLLMEIDINVLITSILSFTNKFLQDNHVKLELNLQENLPLLLIDCDKIKQVFVNLIINSCEAMEGGGVLCISTILEGKWIKISFKDTGIGLDEAQMKNIFNPYYTTKPKGTGLGLSISNGIIQMHDGTIEISSKKGEGSIFTIKLPLAGGQKKGEDNG